MSPRKLSSFPALRRKPRSRSHGPKGFKKSNLPPVCCQSSGEEEEEDSRSIFSHSSPPDQVVGCVDGAGVEVEDVSIPSPSSARTSPKVSKKSLKEKKKDGITFVGREENILSSSLFSAFTAPSKERRRKGLKPASTVPTGGLPATPPLTPPTPPRIPPHTSTRLSGGSRSPSPSPLVSSPPSSSYTSYDRSSPVVFIPLDSFSGGEGDSGDEYPGNQRKKKSWKDSFGRAFRSPPREGKTKQPTRNLVSEEEEEGEKEVKRGEGKKEEKEKEKNVGMHREK